MSSHKKWAFYMRKGVNEKRCKMNLIYLTIIQICHRM